jgi:hypothetical protein
VIIRNAGGRWNYVSADIRRSHEGIAADVRRGRNHGIQLNSIARVIASDTGRRSDHRSDQARRVAVGAHSLERWRTGIGRYREQIRHRVG